MFYDPVTQAADLSVDGSTVLTGFTGETSYYYESALSWGAFSGGQGNFHLVQAQTGLVPVPEPTGLTLMATGIGITIFCTWRRRERRA